MNKSKLSAWILIGTTFGATVAPAALAQNMNQWLEQRAREASETYKRAKPIVDKKLEEAKQRLE